MLLNLIHILGELEDLRQKCESRFTCDCCPLSKDLEFCGALLSLPEQIIDVVYNGGRYKC